MEFKFATNEDKAVAFSSLVAGDVFVQAGDGRAISPQVYMVCQNGVENKYVSLHTCVLFDFDYAMSTSVIPVYLGETQVSYTRPDGY